MITPEALKAFIAKEADKVSNNGNEEVYFTAGAALLAPLLLEAMEALRKVDANLSGVKFRSLKEDGTTKRVVNAHYEAETAVASIEAKLEEKK